MRETQPSANSSVMRSSSSIFNRRAKSFNHGNRTNPSVNSDQDKVSSIGRNEKNSRQRDGLAQREKPQARSSDVDWKFKSNKGWRLGSADTVRSDARDEALGKHASHRVA